MLKEVININKYRVTYSIVIKATGREDAKKKLLDKLGPEDSDYNEVSKFKEEMDVVRVG